MLFSGNSTVNEMIDKKDDDWKGEDKIKSVKKSGNNQNGINFKAKPLPPQPQKNRRMGKAK